jgi:uncharacterized protein YgiB involved in biofilm formation
MAGSPGIRLGRSRTVRAAALVTVGLAAAACDDTPPPDAPVDAAQRQDICEAAHRRLGEDPAHCAALERVAQREHSVTRPHFSSRIQCEATFGQGACEGEGSALPGRAAWRPPLAGWDTRDTARSNPVPVVRDGLGQGWALAAYDRAPQPISDAAIGTAQPDAPRGQLAAFDRRAPTYPDQASCESGWGYCESTPLLNRFVEQQMCNTVWTSCTEVTIPGTPVADSNGTNTNTSTSSGGGGGGGGGGGRYYGGNSHFIWWNAYNNTWRGRYAGSYAPRWQGWGWTGDRAPTAIYRSRSGTQAWDSSARRLTPPRSLASIAGDRSGAALASNTTTISRAGFGSTGRSMSAGG